MATDTWNPDQYERFRAERAQPFFDLLALVRPHPGDSVLDLGCGTGELTSKLHRRLSARETLGLDTSAAMLAKSAAYAGKGVRFEQADLGSFATGEWDVVFSNAAVQWVPDHPALFPRLVKLVSPGGQLALQMPANHRHPSHLVAVEVAREEPFATALGGWVRASPVLAPEEYAALLHREGMQEPHVSLRVYTHVLDSTGDVVEWVRGTLLTEYEQRLGPALFPAFLARYRTRLLETLGDTRPYPYFFSRILLRAVRPDRATSDGR